jgi:hypothetical protein
LLRFIVSTKTEKRQELARIIGYDGLEHFKAILKLSQTHLQADQSYITAKADVQTHQKEIVQIAGHMVVTQDQLFQVGEQLLRLAGFADAVVEDQASYDSAVMFVRARIADQAQAQLSIKLTAARDNCKTFVKSYLNTMLRNPFYIGKFEWGGKTYLGTQPRLVTNELFDRVQDILSGRNKRKCRKHDSAFRGLLTCAEDDCTMTAEVQKGKYIYYRCSGYRGKCSTPYFREEEISQKLGVILKDIQIPDDVARRIEDSFDHDQERFKADSAAQRERLGKCLSTVRRRMDQAYADRLDGKIPEDFWARKMSEWRSEEQQIEVALNTPSDCYGDRVLAAKRILELANKAHFLYVTQKPAEQAKLLRKVLSNCSVDAVSLYPTYRKPFDVIFERAKSKEWSGREDLNLRPPGPEL